MTYSKIGSDESPRTGHVRIGKHAQDRRHGRVGRRLLTGLLVMTLLTAPSLSMAESTASDVGREGGLGAAAALSTLIYGPTKLIYAVGGVAQGFGVVNHLTVYDPATDRWQTLAPMANLREHLAAAAVGGQLYVAGGRRNGVLSDALERYDPATDRWQTLARMPTARGGNGAVVVPGRIRSYRWPGASAREVAPCHDGVRSR